MLLAIDVGNTHTVIGVYDGERLVRHWRLRTDPDRTADEYGVLLLEPLPRLGAAEPGDRPASSSAQRRAADERDRSRSSAGDYFDAEPLVVGPGVKTGMPILYDNPKEVGADRIVNAVAAYERYRGAVHRRRLRHRHDLRLRDRARASTLGGVIAPGLGISLDALVHAHRQAAARRAGAAAAGRRQEHRARHPGRASSTATSRWSTASSRASARRTTPSARVIATGGFAALIAPESTTIEAVDEFLTLDGLRLIISNATQTEDAMAAEEVAQDPQHRHRRAGRRREDAARRRAALRRRRGDAPRPRRRRHARSSTPSPRRSRRKTHDHARRSTTSTWKKHELNVVDTPGYSAFLHDTRNCLRAATGAVSCSARPAARSKVETEKVWGWCERARPAARSASSPASIASARASTTRSSDLQAARREARRAPGADRQRGRVPRRRRPALREGVRRPGRLGDAAGGRRPGRPGRRRSRRRASGWSRRSPRPTTRSSRSTSRAASSRDEELRGGLRDGDARAASSCRSSAARRRAASALHAAARRDRRPAAVAGRPAAVEGRRPEDRRARSSAPPIRRRRSRPSSSRPIVDPFAGKLSVFRVVSGQAQRRLDRAQHVAARAKERLGHLLQLEGKKQTPGRRARSPATSCARRQAEGHRDRRHARRREGADRATRRCPTLRRRHLVRRSSRRARPTRRRSMQALHRLMEEDRRCASSATSRRRRSSSRAPASSTSRSRSSA